MVKTRSNIQKKLNSCFSIFLVIGDHEAYMVTYQALSDPKNLDHAHWDNKRKVNALEDVLDTEEQVSLI